MAKLQFRPIIELTQPPESTE